MIGRSNRETQTAGTGVLRVRVRDLELTPEQVLLPLEFRALQIGHALRIDEHADVVRCHDEGVRPRCVGEVHPVLHASPAPRDDSTPQGSFPPALLRLPDAYPMY